LAAHDLIVFTGGASPTWKLRKQREQFKVEQPARLAIESHIAARDAIVEGLGIGLVPRFQAEPYVRNKKLVEVLPDWMREPAPVHAVFASARYLTPKVRAFVDLACELPANL
jgi:LysR family transcriptional regulator for bpeEF and oprC